MKPSYYNFFFPYEYENRKYIAYNSLSNSMALIDEENYNKYLNFEKHGMNISDESLFHSLKQGNFIINDDINEMDIIRHNMYASRFNTQSLSLTIAVTSDCNFRCIYCFEKDVINNYYMDEEIEKSIIEFVNKKSNTIGHFSVTWYGGEPLLNMKTIERLSEKFIEICNINNIVYSANIVTNGYNITKINLDLLKKYKVSSMQITIDGDEETHNLRRPLKNGYPTFRKIIDNLVILKDELFPVSLRINTDKTNYMNVENVLKILKENELTKVIFPYIARVDSFDDYYDNANCLDMKEHIDNKIKFENLMLEYGYDMKEKNNYPIRKNSICGCDRINTYVVAADGEMYKCWDDVGKKDVSIGNINNVKSKNINKTYFNCIMFDPIIEEKCGKCKYLPICMGGCVKKRIHNINLICEETKSKFENRLRDSALKIRKSKEVSNSY